MVHLLKNKCFQFKPVLVLIKLPSPLSFPAGETFLFQRQKRCLFYLNLIQFDAKQFTVLSVILNP